MRSAHGAGAAPLPAWAEMGLTRAEYERIVSLLGRVPNETELGMFAVLWSEHCSYKHSKRLLRRLPTDGAHVLVGPGENAGVVEVDPNWDCAVAFRMESHNHPCAVEPYEGAATGVGGILRDVTAMGARPVALLGSLRFGRPEASARTRVLVDGVVSGIAGYGNTVGVPAVGGEMYFDESYRENPLCNVMGVGLLQKRRLVKGVASGEGNAVMLVGATTGRDGIHGATFASVELDESSESDAEPDNRTSSIAVGDPFTGKLLIEACLELTETGRVVGIQDMGAAGLTSSLAETADRGGSGVEVDTARVPVRESGMTPYEVMLSESQERMLVIVERGGEADVQAICRRFGLNCAEIGRVTGDGLFRVKERGETVAEIPVAALTREAPVYDPESRRPAYLEETSQLRLGAIHVPGDLGAVLLRLLASPNVASKAWAYRRFDAHVQSRTVQAPGGDAAVLRLDGTRRGIALATDGNGRYTYLDPRRGAALAVAEAARNVVCSGAKPIAITNCLNFGNPQNLEVYWQMEQAVLGIREACLALETPVTGGNVSLYNETDGPAGQAAIYPTPVIGMVGVLDDVERDACTPALKQEGDVVVLVGDDEPSLGGSEYLDEVHGAVRGTPPALDLARERTVQTFVLEAIRQRFVQSAHDLSDGGLAVALAECAIAGEKGVDVDLAPLIGDSLRREGARADVLLFGESASRVLITVPSEKYEALRRLADRSGGVPVAPIGRVARAPRLTIRPGQAATPWIDLSLAAVRQAWSDALPQVMAAQNRRSGKEERK